MSEMRRRGDTAADVTVELESGHAFTLGWERYVPGELLFTPHAAALPTQPLHEMVLDAVLSVELDLQGANPSPNPNPNPNPQPPNPSLNPLTR